MNPVSTITGVIIGVALSAIFGAGIFRKAREEQEKDTKIQIEQVEEQLAKEHQSELQARIAALEADFQKQSEELKTSYQRSSDLKEMELHTRLQALEAQLKQEKEKAIAQSQTSEPELQDTPPVVESEETVSETLPAVDSEETASETLPAVDSEEPVVETPTSPSVETTEDLTQKLTTWGESGQLRYIPQIQQYRYHPDAAVRTEVATALGNLAKGQAVRSELEGAIDLLAQLSLDHQSSVRLAAVQALGNIKSEKVIPHLQKATQDVHGSVKRVASCTLQQFKFYPSPAKPPQPVAPVRKPQEKE